MLCLYQYSQMLSTLIPSYFRLLLDTHLSDMTVNHSSSYQKVLKSSSIHEEFDLVW